MCAYTVKTEIFEGPFDLLLHLVGRQKVDIRDISVAEIADEFIGHIERMQELDLDVASDFLLVAATLLDIKAASLLPTLPVEAFEDLDDLSPEEARELLVERLLAYKKFKNVSGELAARMEAEGRMHPRQAGLEEPFLRLMPDYLEGVTLHSLALICAELQHRREVFLLQAEHVASMPIPLELHVEKVRATIKRRKRISFSELFDAGVSPEIVVVTFLAILELYKEGSVQLAQAGPLDDIEIVRADVARKDAKKGGR